jgi:hypothetical protein
LGIEEHFTDKRAVELCFSECTKMESPFAIKNQGWENTGSFRKVRKTE